MLSPLVLPVQCIGTWNRRIEQVTLFDRSLLSHRMARTHAGVEGCCISNVGGASRSARDGTCRSKVNVCTIDHGHASELSHFAEVGA